MSPLPTPNKGETQQKFVSRCISLVKQADSDTPTKQATAMCYAQWKKKGKLGERGGDRQGQRARPLKKENQHYCYIYGYETKTTETGDLVRGGYIATTHLDSGFLDEERGVWIRDKLPKETLTKWADEINEGNPRTNKVSVAHNREPHVTGVGIKGTARVDLLEDGEYGLYVDSLIDKTKTNFEDTKYRVEKGLLDSYSIEFTTRDQTTGEYLEGAVIEEERDGGIIRTLLRGTQLEGWTLASQPMNENAVMIKEIKKLEENKMTEKKEEEPKDEDVSEEKPAEESKEEEPKNEETAEEDPVKEEPIPEEEKELIKWAKEQKQKQQKEKEYKEIFERVKTSLDTVEPENKVLKNKDEVIETKEVMEYKEIMKPDTKIEMKERFKIAGRFAESKGMFNSDSWTTKLAEMKTYDKHTIKDLSTKTKRCIGIEFKGLSITTNQNTDTDYLLSAAELSDVFDPVIYNALNEATVTWNILAKDDYSNKGNNQVQFTLKIGANTTASAYTGNAITTGNTDRLKMMTKFKKYQVGVEVDGDMMAAARGGPVGDVFALEVKDSTDTLMSVMNIALFAEVGLETAAGVIGFEYITDSAGNTTMYNLTRSATNKLSPAVAGDTYINGASADITLGNLRAAKRQAVKEGAQISNLMFVTDYIQGDKFRGIYDQIQRTVPTSSRFGFEGRPEFDGIPIFEDKDCNDDDWFLVDLESHRIAVWVPPTLEMLGKDADSQKGFIKTYWCTFNRCPRRMVQVYGNATS